MWTQKLKTTAAQTIKSQATRSKHLNQLAFEIEHFDEFRNSS